MTVIRKMFDIGTKILIPKEKSGNKYSKILQMHSLELMVNLYHKIV